MRLFFKNHAKTEAGKLVPGSKDMLLNFDFLEKDLGLASLPHFLSSWFLNKNIPHVIFH